MNRKHFATVKVIQNGRITIPSDIRELEGIEEGNYVRISIEKIEESNDASKQKRDPSKKTNMRT